MDYTHCASVSPKLVLSSVPPDSKLRVGLADR